MIDSDDLENNNMQKKTDGSVHRVSDPEQTLGMFRIRRETRYARNIMTRLRTVKPDAQQNVS